MPRLGGARGLLDELRRTAQAVAVRIAVGVAVLAAASAATAAPAGSERLQRLLASGTPQELLDLAEAEIAAGRYEQAVGLLSALVVQAPRDADLKLLLADLYLRLGARQQARVYLGQALAAAGTAGLAPAQRRAAEALQAFLGDPEAGPSRLAVLGRLSTGLRYRSNANGGTSSDRVLIADQAVDPRDGAAEGDFDWYTTGFAALQAPLAPDLVFDGRGYLLARKQFEQTENDILALRVDPGLAIAVHRAAGTEVTLRPYAALGTTLVQDEVGLLTAGGGVELRQRLGTDWLFHQAVEVQALDFKETEARDFADAQDGSRTSLEVGLRHELTGDLTATLSYGFTYRTAAADFEAFVGHRLRGGASLAYPTPFAITRRESRLRFGAALDLADYDGPNPTYSASEVREDREWAVDLSNALALSEALSLDLSLSYSQRRSSLDNYERDNAEAALGVSFRF